MIRSTKEECYIQIERYIQELKDLNAKYGAELDVEVYPDGDITYEIMIKPYKTDSYKFDGIVIDVDNFVDLNQS